MEQRFDELKTRLAEIHDLRRALEILFWDQTVMMPPGGGAVRGAQVTTLDRIAHERFVSDEIGALLDELAPYEQSLDYDSDEASLIRTTRRDWEKARRVPAELAAEMTGAAAEAHDIWAKARTDDDFALFLPELERAVELKRRYVECFEDYDEPYDVLLDDYEPGMKTAEVRSVFDELKAELVPLIAEHGSVDGDDAFLAGPWPVDAQHAVLAQDHRALRLRPLLRAPRPDGAPVRGQLGHAGHPPDDALPGERHQLDLHGDARVRARPLRARRLAHARADAALPRCLVGAARVAEPPLGEHRRPQPSVLEPLLPLVPGGVPGRARRRRPGALLPRHQPDQAVVHPRRRGRGHLQPPHHPSLRAGAGDPGRHARAEGPAGGMERSFRGVPRHPGSERHPRRAPGRALVGRRFRLLPDLLARQRRLRADLGESALGAARPARSSSSGASSGRCTSGCRPGSTRSAASSRRRRRSSASSAARSTRPRTCAT